MDVKARDESSWSLCIDGQGCFVHRATLVHTVTTQSERPATPSGRARGAQGSCLLSTISLSLSLWRLPRATPIGCGALFLPRTTSKHRCGVMLLPRTAQNECGATYLYYARGEATLPPTGERYGRTSTGCARGLGLRQAHRRGPPGRGQLQAHACGTLPTCLL